MTAPTPETTPRPRPARSPLAPADRARLRRCVALARALWGGLVDGERGKRPLRLAHTLVAELGLWHQHAEPKLYGRRAGGRP